MGNGVGGVEGGPKNVSNVDKQTSDWYSAKYKPKQSKEYPSFGTAVETCARVLNCKEEGRVENLANSLKLADRWLHQVGTHDALSSCLIQYA